MRRLVLLLTAAWLALAGLTPSASAAGGDTTTVQIGGRTYVRLRDWGASNGVTVSWIKPARILRLSKGDTQIVLKHNSSVAEFNGVNVALVWPAVLETNKAFLSPIDVKSTLNPLFFPPRGPLRVRTVALDPGHGGKDKGFVNRSTYEKDATLLLARDVRDLLLKAGLKVVFTRDSDRMVELEDRVETARARRADLFVSLHFNAGADSASDAKGVEVYCVTPPGAPSTNSRGQGGGGPTMGNAFNNRSVNLAWQLQKTLIGLGLEDRGVRRARFEVLRDAFMPAVLIEGGFLSNPDERKKILDPAFRKKMATAIANGIVAYKSKVEIAAPAPPSTPAKSAG